MRSFAEHKAAMTPYERSAVVEAGPLFSLLFLNNNLHYVHHKRPDLPWHALPAYWRDHRRELLAENGGLLYRGYPRSSGAFCCARSTSRCIRTTDHVAPVTAAAPAVTRTDMSTAVARILDDLRDRGGLKGVDIANIVGASPPTVSLWTKR